MLAKLGLTKISQAKELKFSVTFPIVGRALQHTTLPVLPSSSHALSNHNLSADIGQKNS